MFGFPTRAEATTNTMIKQMTEMLRRQWGDLPSHVWRDPYVVRYMQILICGLLKINSQGKLSGEELGMPAARIWCHATGEDPAPFMRWAANALSAPSRSAVARAFDDAGLWLTFYNRRPNMKSMRAQQVFDAAQRQDREMLTLYGEASDTMASAAAILFMADIGGRVGDLVGGQRQWRGALPSPVYHEHRTVHA